MFDRRSQCPSDCPDGRSRHQEHRRRSRAGQPLRRSRRCAAQKSQSKGEADFTAFETTVGGFGGSSSFWTTRPRSASPQGGFPAMGFSRTQSRTHPPLKSSVTGRTVVLRSDSSSSNPPGRHTARVRSRASGPLMTPEAVVRTTPAPIENPTTASDPLGARHDHPQHQPCHRYQPVGCRPATPTGLSGLGSSRTAARADGRPTLADPDRAGDRRLDRAARA